MPILENDIQIMASQVLADVPEGGGAATGTEIADGVSNNLFPDISELDRVYGDVALRKVFPAVRTESTDTYFGAHVIIADAPDDPDVSGVLFRTGDFFDRREAAAGRIESYLAQGPLYRGQLYGTHIAGMMTVMMIQRQNVPVPAIGDTILLRKNEGLMTQDEQYVRVTDVSESIGEFTEGSYDFTRLIVTLGISDQLRFDLTGFQAQREDSAIDYAGKGKVYETIVADAARYYGIKPLTETALLGAFSVQADGIYAQLVPSSRAETPIADARMNQQAQALVAAGSTFSQVFTTSFNATQNLFIGGGVLPGSLTITMDSTVVSDAGGRLMLVDVPVGTIDYASGIAVLSANVFGTPGNAAKTVAYTPASTSNLVTESIGINITAPNQRLTYVVTLNPSPAKASLQVSYLTQGRWYVLQEDGTGAVRGVDPSLGAGSLNYTTGTVALTLGALPDVGSKVILSWSPKTTVTALTTADLGNEARFSQTFFVGPAITPGSLEIAWNDGTDKLATDDNGSIIGDAIGQVFYAQGRVVFSPNSLPAKDTPITFTLTEITTVEDDISAFGDGGSTWTGSLGSAVEENSVEISVVVQHVVRAYPGIDSVQKSLLRVFDNGGGLLQIANLSGNLSVGTVNYSTGAITLNKSTAGYQSVQGVWVNQAPTIGLPVPEKIVFTGQETRSLTLSVLNGPGGDTLTSPTWTWWSGAQAGAAMFRVGTTAGSGYSSTQNLSSIVLLAKPDLNNSPLNAVASATTYSGAIHSYATPYWANVAFSMGGDRYTTQTLAGGTEIRVVRNASGATGEGTNVGSQTPYNRHVTLTEWSAGISPVVSQLAGSQATPIDGAGSLSLTDGVTFRTATSPLSPEAFSLLGTFDDGATFNVSADEDGVVSASGVYGTVDYETGVAEIRFGTPVVSGPPTNPQAISVAYLSVPGVTWLNPRQARADTLRYNAVAYNYIPLDAEILGLDPVRLPPDGRVPIFRKGTVVVVHHTAVGSPATVSNAQTIDLGRVRLSRVKVVGANGATITSGYTTNLDAGTITFTDVTGYSQPVTIENRIEDAALLADAQISGLLRLTRPLTHDYPAGSQVSSALLIGDMFARVASLFDQVTWTNVWSDDQIGSSASGTYNAIDYPPVIENLGAVTERWSLIFTGSTAFNIVGEHLGNIGVGNTSTGCSPLNPATGTPYFTLDPLGFGTGWSTGNVIRLNTVGAIAPIWVARVIQQGVATELNDSFTLLVRGDIDTP